MRELVYLSDRKLKQFVPERRRSRIGRQLTAFRATTPMGGLELEVAEDSDSERQKQKHLALVVRHIEEQSMWCQDPTVRAGRWVYFEAPLSVFAAGMQPDTVMFLDPEPGMVEGYEQPHGARLLLHGSSNHLLDCQAAPLPFPYNSFRGSRPAYAGATLYRLSQVSPPTAEDQDDPTPFLDSSVEVRFSKSIFRLFRAARTVAPAWGSAWMRGYARVSAALTIDMGRFDCPCLLATPLYVEYANDLP